MTTSHDSAAARLRHISAAAAAAALVSDGRSRGLFRRLRDASPVRAVAFAAVAGLDAGWVRDWLDGLVLARLVDHDGARGTYAIASDTVAALDAHANVTDDEDRLLAIEAARVEPGVAEGVLVLDLGGDLARTIADARARAGADHVVVLVDVDAAARVADNLDHPLGPLLYARSLERRARGRGPLVGSEALRHAAIAGGMRDVRVHRVDVAGVPFAFVCGRA